MEKANFYPQIFLLIQIIISLSVRWNKLYILILTFFNKMKTKLLIFLTLAILVLFGCQNETKVVTKYQCENGEFVDKISECENQSCPEPKEKIITKFQCENGEFVNESEKCEERTCPDIPEEKALITNFPADWYINQEDEDEVIFSFIAVNYGNVEAKNVKVKCQFIDAGYDGFSEQVIAEKTKNIGNVASTSTSYEEIILEPSEKILDTHYYTTYCYPVECDGCEILFERVPELKEELE